MKKPITPYNDASKGKKEQVTQMFDSVSPKYDLLNRVISLGIDQSWRKKVVQFVGENNPKQLLDIATGTGDLAIALQTTQAEKIVGLDISPGMLNIGKDKVNARGLNNRIEMILGDSEDLPFDNNSFDGITVAFGVRNFETLEKGLFEIFRVLRPKGKLVILETAVPTRFPFKQGYRLYSGWIVPLIGKLFSKDKSAYQYLSDSAAAFPHGKVFNNI